MKKGVYIRGLPKENNPHTMAEQAAENGITFAAFMVYLYALIFRKNKPVMKGLKIGIFIGVLWIFPYTFTMAGAHNTSMIYVFKNTIWHMVEQGIGGIIIAFVYTKKRME